MAGGVWLALHLLEAWESRGRFSLGREWRSSLDGQEGEGGLSLEGQEEKGNSSLGGQEGQESFSQGGQEEEGDISLDDQV